MEELSDEMSPPGESGGGPRVLLGRGRSYDMKANELGVYRWEYTENLYRKPVGLGRTLKVFNWVFAGAVLLVQAVDGFGVTFSGFKAALITYGICVVFFALSYYIYAVIRGGRNMWHFAMDEEGMDVYLKESDSKRVKVVDGMLRFMAAFSLILSLVRRLSPPTDVHFPFVSVRKIHPDRRNDLIDVYVARSRYRVFVPNEHFDFVLNHITTRCNEYLVK